MSDLIPHTTISAIVSHRNAALTKIQQAVEMLSEGFRLADEAHKQAQQAHGTAVFTLSDRSRLEPYRQLFQKFEPSKSVECFRQQIDARTWMNLIQLTRMDTLMDKTAKEDLYKNLSDNVPEITMDNIKATLEALMGDAELIFQRGLARAFSDLDRRFKSHDAFKLGSRIILTNVFDQWGMWNYHMRMRDTLADIERVFAVLDNQKNHDPQSLSENIQKDRSGGWHPRQSMTETPYFKVRTYKNGNAHLWFKRDDLVQKANKILAAYYGEVLPDGVPKDMPVSDITSKTGALSKDLAFYPTPTYIVKTVLQHSDIYFDANSVVLEPSAGTGNMVREILARKAGKVDAIEIHPDRVRALKTIEDPRLTVQEGNFLQTMPRPKYTHVVMNPPFYSTHWMKHIVHAFEFLAPGGTLVAILPISAELGESKKHRTFRQWAKKHTRWNQKLNFHDLPAESFQMSGTRINTVFITLYKHPQEDAPRFRASSTVS